MKLFISTLVFSAVSLLAFNTDKEKKELPSLEIGAEAPMTDHKMKDISGTKYTLNDLKKENGLLVVFSCNTCPFVVGGDGFGEGWQTRYNELQGICDKLGVGMVLVNSNEAKRKGADSFERMKDHASENNYKSKYVVDKKSKLANAFGAKTTPHVYLFDSNMSLVYKGAIDDSNKSKKEVKSRWLIDALSNMANDKSIDPAETRNKGCSIKRVKK